MNDRLITCSGGTPGLYTKKGKLVTQLSWNSACDSCAIVSLQKQNLFDLGFLFPELASEADEMIKEADAKAKAASEKFGNDYGEKQVNQYLSCRTFGFSDLTGEYLGNNDEKMETKYPLMSKIIPELVCINDFNLKFSWVPDMYKHFPDYGTAFKEKES